MNRKLWLHLTAALLIATAAVSFHRIGGGQGVPVDPGPRGGAAGAGGALSGLATAEVTFFTLGQTRFQEIDSVSGAVSGEPGRGLGPRYNLNSCAGCHAFPAAGGGSPAANPQVAIATLDGAANTVP